MKILVFSGAYVPAQKYGGPVTGLYNFVENLSGELEIEIVCRNHDLHDQTPFPGIEEGFQPVGKAQVCYLPDKKMRRAVFRGILLEREPNCLYLSSIFDVKMNVPLLRLARSLHIPVVYAPRGELSPAVLKMKAVKKRVFLFLMRLARMYQGVFFHATSEEEREDIIRAIHAKNVFCVPNLPCAPVNDVRREKRAGELRVVWISRIHRSKNLLYAIERVLPVRGDVTFDIYGPIEQADYWELCRKHLSETIRYRGQVPVGQAAAVFSQYDCFLFPTQSENYSHAIAECLLSGTIPVISAGTTPWDGVQYAIPLDKPQEFTQALQTLCDMNDAAFQEQCRRVREYAAQKIKMEELTARTREMFEQAVDAGKC